MRLGAVFLAGLLLMFAAPVGAGAHQASRRQSSRFAGGSYNGAAIAETALRYVGGWGGYACGDTFRSGETGKSGLEPMFPDGASPTNPPKAGARINPAGGGDGQCRAFVNCIVWMASGHTQWLGLAPTDYFYAFTHPSGGGVPGVEVPSVGQLTEGDIVQQGQTANARKLHTYIIVKRIGASSFEVVDSNHGFDEYVREHPITLALSSTVRAFRMGTPAGPCPRTYQDPAGRFLPYGEIGWNVVLAGGSSGCVVLKVTVVLAEADYRQSQSALAAVIKQREHAALEWLRSKDINTAKYPVVYSH